MKQILFILVILATSIIGVAQDIGGDYYVAHPDSTYPGMNPASDTNDGSYLNPFATWQKAFDTAIPGDIIYFRGGVWEPTATTFQSAITLIDPHGQLQPANPRGASGTAANPIHYLNYPNEYPILDARHITADGDFLGGISLQLVNYITFRGLEIRNVWQQKFGVTCRGISTYICSNLTFENMKVHDIAGQGMWLTSVLSAVNPPTITTDTSRVINCDFYNCADTLENTPFNMGDGIKGDLEVGGVFILEGNRFWNCSDDGVDLSGPGQKILTDCWTFENGVNYVSIQAPDDGNGFKLGGVRDSIDAPNWIMTRCISANNYRFAIHGLDYNPYYRNNARVYNSIFWGNNAGQSAGPWSFDNVDKPWEDSEFYNCVTQNHAGLQIRYPREHPVVTCNWDWAGGSYPYVIPNSVCTVTVADFVSVDTDLLKAQRNIDNSLPTVNTFQLVPSSDMIDKGTDVGLPYSGTAPDVGVFEYVAGEPIASFTAVPNPAEINQTVSFDGSASSDDGTIISYEWTFGDGNFGTGITDTHSYVTAGAYIAWLKVTDNEANVDSTSRSITINQAPIGGITTIAELEAALATAQPGDILLLEANSFVGDITITADGASGNYITITNEVGYTPIFQDNVTINGGDFIRMTNLGFNGNISISNCQGAYLDNNIMTGPSTYIYTKPRSGNKGRDWIIDDNTYNGVTTSTFNGYNFGIYQSIYKFDVHSVAQ